MKTPSVLDYKIPSLGLTGWLIKLTYLIFGFESDCPFTFASQFFLLRLQWSISFGRLPELTEQQEQLLLVDNTEGFSNSSGLCLRVLADLQKMLGCKTVHLCSDPAILDPHTKKTLKLQSTTSHLFSSRINLAFRSNALLKTGVWVWGSSVADFEVEEETTNFLEVWDPNYFHQMIFQYFFAFSNMHRPYSKYFWW